PRVLPLLFEKLPCVGQRAWLQQQKYRHDVVDDSHVSPQAYAVNRTGRAPFTASASRTRSGVTGVRSTQPFPMSFRIALSTAAVPARAATSPTPFAPTGLLGSGMFTASQRISSGMSRIVGGLF